MARFYPPPNLVNLANAFRDGKWTLRGLIARGQRACPNDAREIRRVARRVHQAFAGDAPPLEDLLVFLEALGGSRSYWESLDLGRFYWAEQSMSPQGTPALSWPVPPLTTPQQLADWLGISAGRLAWFADLGSWCPEASSAKLRHYVYRWQPRRRGRFRLIESPKPTLKKVQRQILHELLGHIPPHPAAHGFCPGRSIRSYAAPHVGQDIVLHFDLRDFFPAIRASRIHAVFRTAGYPREVARLLTGLCTSRIPAEVWENRPEPRDSDTVLGERLRGRHLPQGAPSSPALANLCARRLDARLYGLAQSLGAAYTRYADDLAFSGGKWLEEGARRFQIAVAVIAAEEGFELHFQKSRFMRRAVRQQLAGVVVNERPNIRRPDYDRLKAILTNCIRHGPTSQNRAGHPDFRGHLLGRIAHVRMIHPERGDKLKHLFDRITW